VNNGILTRGYQPPPMPYGLLGRPTPVPIINDRAAIDPRDISGLSVWYDASDWSTITLNGSAVSQWGDKSGNGLHASQSTANNQPTYAANRRNGLAVVTFDGVNDSLVTSSFADGWTAFTSFSVFNATTSIGIGLQILWTRSTDRQRAVVIQASSGASVPFSIRGHLNSAGGSDYDTAAFGVFNSFYYMTNRWDGTTFSKPTAFTARTNKTDRANTQTGGFTASNVANTVLRIGNRSDGTRGFIGHIGELLVYSAALSAADRDKVEDYLKTKWGF